MAEKELRKLKRKELLEMLLVQSREAERLQREFDEASAELTELRESYERLKIKLNVKDERLNQKDVKIAELNRTIKEMQESKAIELEKAGSIAEAALRLNGIFELAQECADQYLMNVRRLSEKHSAEKIETEEPQEPEEEPEEVIPEKQAVIMEEDHEERPENRKQIPFDPAWRSGGRKRQAFFPLRKGTAFPELKEDSIRQREADGLRRFPGELHG